jgi:3-hydroxyisobutyrate dehydrogenase
MATFAFLGTGLIGAGMAERQLSLGNSVTVWNRTKSKTTALVSLGATSAADPAGAARGAFSVHLALPEDGVVDAVLEEVLPALTENQIVVDHSTTLPASTIERAKRLLSRGIQFLHAPVFMSPAACKNGMGVMVVAGPSAAAEAVRPTLATMTGEVWYVGERADLAAAYKLFGNAMIFALCAGLSDVFAIGKSMNISSVDVHQLFSHFNPAGVLQYRGQAMAHGDFSPSFELTMARKDLRLMLETAGANRELLAVLPSLARKFDEMIERGYGGEDLGVIAKDAVGR